MVPDWLVGVASLVDVVANDDDYHRVRCLCYDGLIVQSAAAAADYYCWKAWQRKKRMRSTLYPTMMRLFLLH